MQGNGDNRGRLETLPQRYAQFDLLLAWEVRATGSETVVDGVLKNVRYQYMEGIEIRIAAIDASGATIARSGCFVIPSQLRMDQVTNFTVRLPLLQPSTRLHFTYKYQGSDGGEGGINWMQSFDSVVPAPSENQLET